MFLIFNLIWQNFFLFFSALTFDSTSYTTSLQEGTYTDVTIFSIPITNPSGTITCSIESGSKNIFSVPLFAIDSNSTHCIVKTLSTSNNYDYESLASLAANIVNLIPVPAARFVLQIKATNTTDTAYTSLTVDFTNDKQCSIDGSNAVTLINEKSINTVGDTIVYKFETLVPYGGIPAQYIFEIDSVESSPGVKNIFEFSNKELFLKNNAVIDYETTQQYTVHVNCKVVTGGSTDLSTLELGSNFTLTINVVDDNDNNNIFNATTYSFSVNENEVNGTTIGQVFASDADITAANKATYYYVGGNQFSDKFSINESTGIITVAGNLDYETATSYALTVCATDNATDITQTNPLANIRSSCVPVTITLVDVNDNNPIFMNYPYSIEVSEKVPVGRAVFTFSASDADSGTNAEIEYKSVTMDTSLFALDAKTGIVSVIAVLNYESATSHNVTIYAEDKGKILSNYHSLIRITI